MNRTARAVLAALAFADLAQGGLLLLYPGFWQEVMHPLAMGTVFYPLQHLGAVRLGRAALAGSTAVRPAPTRLAALAALWAVEVPGDLLLAWRTADTGPYTLWFYGLRAGLGLGIGAWLWRCARRCP